MTSLAQYFVSASRHQRTIALPGDSGEAIIIQSVSSPVQRLSSRATVATSVEFTD